ncbi:MAG: nucleotidyltransferase domain-containing protein [Chitinophagales bacterium]|nr:nucleotidyltransferase domain-containing protein [Chitinophagales bacterium]
MQLLKKNIAQISKLCKENHVKSLFAFGSIVNGAMRNDSDIDLLVDIDDKDPLIYADSYFNLKFQLQQLLNHDIDLLEQKSMRNAFLQQEIDRTKVLVYGS